MFSISLTLWTAVIAIVVYCTSKVFSWFYKQYKIRSILNKNWPSMPHHWFWGHMALIRKIYKSPQKMIEMIKDTAANFPHGSVVFIGPLVTYLRICHQSACKLVLGGSEKNFPKSEYQYDAIVPWLGKGLLVLKGGEWHRHRRLLTNSFHWDILRPYCKKMNSSSQTLMDKWHEKTKTGESNSVETFKDLSLMTIDALMQCLFGIQTNCQTEQSEHQTYVSCIYKLSYYIVSRFRTQNFFLRYNWVYNLTKEGREFLKYSDDARDYAEKVVKKRREEYASGVSIGADLGFNKKNRRHYDFLDVLLQAKDTDGSHLTDREISDEVNTFMFEGHDTTTSAISWLCYCMAKYPEHQKACYNEIIDILGDREEIEMEDLSKFEYLTYCIKETLRMFPPVPTILRKPTIDTKIEERNIPKGTEILVSILAVHYNPVIWENPHEFDPLRFAPENSAGRDPYAFIPFSAGLRNCIGQNFAMNEIKICISHVLMNFKLALDESKPVQECIELIYRTKGGLHLMITPRK